jgi:hypothetical protein
MGKYHLPVGPRKSLRRRLHFFTEHLLLFRPGLARGASQMPGHRPKAVNPGLGPAGKITKHGFSWSNTYFVIVSLRVLRRLLRSPDSGEAPGEACCQRVADSEAV